MKKLLGLFPLSILILLSSCQTSAQVDSTPSAERPIISSEETDESISIDELLNLYEQSLNDMSNEFHKIPRNIDDPEWIASFVDYAVSVDIFSLQYLYNSLLYPAWTEELREQFITSFMADDADFLTLRAENHKELIYIADQSLALSDLPWLDHSIYSPESEFNYWYLCYTMDGINHNWVEARILPTLLSLIPEDRVTPASYLWLKSSLSLESMDAEILQSGYPWTSIFYLRNLNLELVTQGAIELKERALY